MPDLGHTVSLEEQIDQWRSYLHRRQASHSVDVAELEDQLREQVAVLVDAGLATDEAFLVAVKRMGDLDALSREFAREHSDRLWKQLVVVPSDSGDPQAWARTDAVVAFCLAVAAAVLIKVPALFGMQLDQDDELLRPQSESFRAAPPDRLFRLETAARHQHAPLAGRGVRRGGCIRQRLSLRPGRLHRGAYGAAPADRALAGGGDRLRRRSLEPGRGPHGLHSILGRAVHLLRADRPRRRRAHGVHGADLPVHRDRHRAVLRSRGCCRAERSGPSWSPPGWWRPSKA